MSEKEAVILVGHGGVPRDFPGDQVKELKSLEAQRQARKIVQMGPREAELDKKIREWPRTPETDPYKFGLDCLAHALAGRLSGKKLVTAYNEFCGPSVEEAIAGLVREGFKKITLVTTMFTPGGSHSEFEIPELVRLAGRQYPGVEIRYAWPFDMGFAADFIAGHLEKSAGSPR